jgi:hypothetical protein
LYLAQILSTEKPHTTQLTAMTQPLPMDLPAASGGEFSPPVIK